MLERFKSLIFVVVILAIASGIIALLTYKPAPVVITINPPGPTSTPKPIHVYITGAVSSGQKTYELPAGSRVEDAIKIAGGASTDADLSQINLARLLNDGEQVNVPSQAKVANTAGTSTGSQSTSNMSAGNTTASTVSTPKAKATEVKASPENPVHINTADLTELERLPGVGPSLGQHILDYRNQHGPFKSMSDLDKVEGIGPSKLTDWEKLVIFD